MSLIELSGLTGIFQKKSPQKLEEKAAVWDYFNTSSAEQPKSAKERLRKLKSNWEIKNCIQYLSQEYQRDWERYKAFKEIPDTVTSQIVKATFELYRTIVLLETNEADFATFKTQLNALHAFINDQPYNSNLGVLQPTRKYLEHLLQFTEAEKTSLQKRFFDALIVCEPLPHTIDHSHYLGNDIIEFSTPWHSTTDTTLLTSTKRETDFNRAACLEEVLLQLDYPASMFGHYASKLPESEQKRFLELLSKASPSFRTTSQTIDQLNHDDAALYQMELCLFFLSGNEQPLLRSKAARSLMIFLAEIDKSDRAPKLPSLLVTQIQTAVIAFLNTEYIDKLPPNTKSIYAWVEVLFGKDFFQTDFLPTVLKHLDLNFPDMFGMVLLTKLIAEYRNRSAALSGLQSPMKAAEFLAFCVSGLEETTFNTTLLQQLKPLNVSPKSMVELVIFASRSSENAEAIDWNARDLAETMSKVPLSLTRYTELIGLWVKNKSYKDSNPGRNIARNLRRMLLLEQNMPGCIDILLAEPFNIRFFDRYRQEDLLLMAQKTQNLKERNTTERPLYNPKKTIFLTTTWYDNNDAFYGESDKKLLEKAREKGFEVIIIEINSPAQLFRSLKELFLLNQSQPFAANWIFRAHGGLEGSIRMGSKDDPSSRILPAAVDTIMTHKMQSWFGSNPIQLILDSCYAGTNWVKQIGTKLNWHVVGQEGSAGLLLWFSQIDDNDEAIHVKATNERGETLPQVKFDPNLNTTKVVQYSKTVIH